MSRSPASSIDFDLEKCGGAWLAFGRAESPVERVTGRQLTGARRKRSRNFSRPSQESSIASIDSFVMRRLSSDDEGEPSQVRKVHAAHDVATIRSTPSIPVFAQRAVDSHILREPPPSHPASPEPGRHSRGSTRGRSIDVVEAATTAPSHGWRSTRSLLSTVREKSKLDSTPFARRVFDAGKPDLLYDLRTTKRLKDRRQGVLDLTTLQRMNQHVLQQKLVEQVRAMGEKGAWMEIGIKQTLHDYCEANRDMEYMEQCAMRGTDNDPFLLCTAKPMDCKLLEDAGLAFGDPRKRAPSLPDRLQYTRRESPSKQKLRRLLMSLLGGLALIFPFLIVVLLDNQLVRVVVTCAFMLAFAVAFSLGSEMGPDRLALITAAYAAALVIFVGNNPPAYRYRS